MADVMEARSKAPATPSARAAVGDSNRLSCSGNAQNRRSSAWPERPRRAPRSGRAAVTVRKVDKGHAVYMGTYLTDSLAKELAEMLFACVGVEPLIPDLSPNVEVTCARGKAAGCFSC
jgi:hypothetical protein